MHAQDAKSVEDARSVSLFVYSARLAFSFSTVFTFHIPTPFPSSFITANPSPSSASVELVVPASDGGLLINCGLQSKEAKSVLAIWSLSLETAKPKCKFFSQS
ncbi:hypothetical protein DM860_006468 [Cuscuta australis]|uniref:Uncharacterized protein n=1 Tax=Cuscuta australis TaxID=267555 RepID=A0A328D7E7_9ASTE|nr:hypothetical protein DM860_006468 [Cuscuta australis]